MLELIVQIMPAEIPAIFVFYYLQMKSLNLKNLTNVISYCSDSKISKKNKMICSLKTITRQAFLSFIFL